MRSKYRQMRIMIFYDLPMDDKEKVREYGQFRKQLLKHGFYQLQYSIYVKVVKNEAGFEKFVRMIQHYIPKSGNIRIMKVTEKQYDSMIFLQGSSNIHELIVGDKQIVYFGSDTDE